MSFRDLRFEYFSCPHVIEYNAIIRVRLVLKDSFLCAEAQEFLQTSWL